jgi:hypothetical protein
VPGKPPAHSEAVAFIHDELLSYLFPAALRAAVLCNVADHLVDGPQFIGELSQRTATTESALYRVLRLLASKDIFTEVEPGRFALTTRAEVLCGDAENSVRSAVLMMTDSPLWRAAGELAESLTGEGPAFDHVFGSGFFGYLAQQPEAAETFHRGMAAWSDADNQAVAQACRIPSGATVVDVGGGHGGLLLELLRHNPATHGILFDWDYVLPENRLREADLPGRWHAAHGDFFVEVPAADVYVLKRILHDWDDAACIRVLENCRSAMKPGGRIFVVDGVITEDDNYQQAKALDVLMLALLPGGERTTAQFDRVFAAAGLRTVSVIDLPTASVSISELAV